MSSRSSGPAAEPKNERRRASRKRRETAGLSAEAVAESGSLGATIGRVAAASAVALVFTEVVSLGQTVALARLLSPTEVGVFTAGTVLTMLMTTFVEGGLRSGLVHREGNLDDAAETVFWASLGYGLLMTIGALATAPLVGMVFKSREIGEVAAATSGFLLLFSLTNVPDGLLQRNFSVMRRVIVGPGVAISFAVVSVCLAALGFGIWSMVLGTYASYLFWVISVWVLADWRPGRGHASVKLWRELARFGSPVVANMVGSRLQQTVEAAFIGRVLSSAALGFYRYGQRIAQIPVRFIIEVGAISLFPAFARIAGDRERLEAAYLRAMRLATFGAAPLTGLIIALGEPAVVVVFGSRWREAGLVVVAMAGLGLGKAWMSVSEEAIKGAGRTKLLNWQTLTEVLLGIGLMVVLVETIGLVGVGLATSITALVVGVLVVGLARSVVGVPLRRLFAAIGPPLPAAAVAFVVTFVLEHSVLHSAEHSILTGLLFLVSDTLLFAVIYLFALALLAPTMMRDLSRIGVRLARRVIRRGGDASANQSSTSDTDGTG